MATNFLFAICINSVVELIRSVSIRSIDADRFSVYSHYCRMSQELIIRISLKSTVNATYRFDDNNH